MRKIIEILAQLIISTIIFAGIFYAALPKYDHAEAQNTLRNHFTIMFRVQQGIGKFQNRTFDPEFDNIAMQHIMFPNSLLQSNHNPQFHLKLLKN